MLQVEIEGLRQQIVLLRDERDDLRRRLDAEAEERRRLTRLLTESASNGFRSGRTAERWASGLVAPVVVWIGLQQRLLPPPRQDLVERLAEAMAWLRRPKGSA